MGNGPLTFEKVGHHGLWIALMTTGHGVVEVLVEGAKERPDERKVAALQPFLARTAEITASTRRKLPFPGFLYRLTRVAVNQDGKVGLQFLNRVTGSRPLVIADEA